MDKTPVIPPKLQGNYDNWHFSPAIESGDFVFLSGCTGTQPDGSNDSDPATQFRHSFEKVLISLNHAGLTFDNVVEMTSYHVGLQAHLKTFMSVKDEFVNEPYPAWTAIGVSELASKTAIIEIKVIARKST